MLAVVGMGTNSFHMVVVRDDNQGWIQLIDTRKEDVRLGSGSPDMSVITPDAEERALAAMKRFKILAHTRNAVMRVVGRGLLNLSGSVAGSSGLQPNCLGGGYRWRVDGVCSREGLESQFLQHL